jgi:hypothetical protein
VKFGDFNEDAGGGSPLKSNRMATHVILRSNG